jgi:hypothetical protein
MQNSANKLDYNTHKLKFAVEVAAYAMQKNLIFDIKFLILYVSVSSIL